MILRFILEKMAQKGRQGSGYYKLKLFSSKYFKRDAYLLFFPKGCIVPPHTDPISIGPHGERYDHFRKNIDLWGKNNGGEIYLMPDVYAHDIDTLSFPPLYEIIFLGSHGIEFKASQSTHGMTQTTGWKIMLSLGRLEESRWTI
jgi:hypothetical protein